jgi:hypothetical protein
VPKDVREVYNPRNVSKGPSLDFLGTQISSRGQGSSIMNLQNTHTYTLAKCNEIRNGRAPVFFHVSDIHSGTNGVSNQWYYT